MRVLNYLTVPEQSLNLSQGCWLYTLLLCFKNLVFILYLNQFYVQPWQTYKLLLQFLKQLDNR